MKAELEEAGGKTAWEWADSSCLDRRLCPVLSQFRFQFQCPIQFHRQSRDRHHRFQRRRCLRPHPAPQFPSQVQQEQSAQQLVSVPEQESAWEAVPPASVVARRVPQRQAQATEAGCTGAAVPLRDRLPPSFLRLRRRDQDHLHRRWAQP